MLLRLFPLFFNIPCMHVPRLVYSFICGWTFGLFPPFVVIKVSINISVQIFVNIDAFITLGKLPGVKWLGYLVGVYLTFQETVKVFSKVI